MFSYVGVRFFFLKRGITFTHYAAIFSFDLISQMFSKSIQIDLLHLKKKKKTQLHNVPQCEYNNSFSCFSVVYSGRFQVWFLIISRSNSSSY